MSERDNVTAFPSDPGAVSLEIDRRTIYNRTCPHSRVALRESRSRGYSDRHVYCLRCKERLDPMQILWRYAQSEGNKRAMSKAWDDLEGAWAWLWENGGTLSISRAGGVRGSMMINGKRRTRKPHPAESRGLPGQVVAVVEALKMMKRWN